MRVMTSRSERRGLAESGSLAAFGLFAAVILGLILSYRQPPRSVLQLGPSSAPQAGGVETSVGEAARGFPAPLFRPDAQLASDSTIGGIWIRAGEDPEVYIQYESGVALTIRPASQGLPTEEYAAAQIKDGVPGSIVDVGGVAAFEVPQSDEGDLGSVRMVIDDVIVVIIGHGDFPPSVLRDVATSVVSNVDEVRATT